MRATSRRAFRGIAPGRILALFTIAALAGAAIGCGGGSGGSGSGDTLQGLVLVDFIQAGQDNLPLNRTLEFRFSAPLDPTSVGPASLQVRAGPTYGLPVDGRY